MARRLRHLHRTAFVAVQVSVPVASQSFSHPRFVYVRLKAHSAQREELAMTLSR
jgi:hypothetical protein